MHLSICRPFVAAAPIDSRDANCQTGVASGEESRAIAQRQRVAELHTSHCRTLCSSDSDTCGRGRAESRWTSRRLPLLDQRCSSSIVVVVAPALDVVFPFSFPPCSVAVIRLVPCLLRMEWSGVEFAESMRLRLRLAGGVAQRAASSEGRIEGKSQPSHQIRLDG